MQQSNTFPNDEFLGNELYKHFVKDQTKYILRGSRSLLLLHKLTKWKFLEYLLYDMTRFHLYRTSKVWLQSPYQEVLDHIMKEINNILIETKYLPNPIDIKYKDVRGFDIFNSSASPWFGENLIQVQSGLFWFSHILTRSLEPFIIQECEDKKFRFPKRHFKKKFLNTITALITENHTLSFSKFHIIFKNDSILTGLKTFIIAHEYAHLLINKYGIEHLNLSNYYSDNTLNNIFSDDEIVADSIGLIILNLYSKKKNDSLMLYSPRLLFLVLSLLEKSELLPKPIEHPTSISRYENINIMSMELGENKDYNRIDKIISLIYREGEQKLKLKIARELKKQENTIEMFKLFQEKMVLRGYRELLNFD